MSVDIDDLKRLTNQFFLMHWDRSVLGCEPPEWSDPYRFEGGSAPNYDKQGLYAFLKDREITYIGVGASLGGGRYIGHGLGKRLMTYSRVIDGKSVPTDARLIDAGAFLTIGFERDHAYLALALESYLLGRMPTIHNVHRQGRPSDLRVS